MRKTKMVYFYTKHNCKLCEEAKQMLQIFQSEYNFTIVEQNIYQDERLLETYFLTIPVIRVDDEELTAEELSFVTVEKFLAKNLKG